MSAVSMFKISLTAEDYIFKHATNRFRNNNLRIDYDIMILY